MGAVPAAVAVSFAAARYGCRNRVLVSIRRHAPCRSIGIDIGSEVTLAAPRPYSERTNSATVGHSANQARVGRWYHSFGAGPQAGPSTGATPRAQRPDYYGVPNSQCVRACRALRRLRRTGYHSMSSYHGERTQSSLTQRARRQSSLSPDLSIRRTLRGEEI